MWMSHPSLPGVVKTVTDAAFYGGWDSLGWVVDVAPVGPPQPDAGWPVSEGEVVTLVGEAVATQLPAAITPVVAAAIAESEAGLNSTYVRVTNRPANVIDKGADPTGVADSSAAIRDAIASSGTIDFGKGNTYLVSRDAANAWALSSPGEQQWIGQGATLKLAPGTAPGVSIVRPLGNNFTIRDLVLDGNRANQSVEAQKQRHGIFLDQVDHVTLVDVKAKNVAGDSLLLWRSTDYITVRGGEFFDTDRNGISLTGSGQRILVDGLSVYGVAVQAVDAECDTGIGPWRFEVRAGSR